MRRLAHFEQVFVAPRRATLKDLEHGPTGASEDRGLDGARFARSTARPCGGTSCQAQPSTRPTDCESVSPQTRNCPQKSWKSRLTLLYAGGDTARLAPLARQAGTAPQSEYGNLAGLGDRRNPVGIPNGGGKLKGRWCQKRLAARRRDSATAQGRSGMDETLIGPLSRGVTFCLYPSLPTSCRHSPMSSGR